MKLRLHIMSLALLLALGVACNKPSSTGDNSVPNGDDAAAEPVIHSSPPVHRSRAFRKR